MSLKNIPSDKYVMRVSRNDIDPGVCPGASKASSDLIRSHSTKKHVSFNCYLPGYTATNRYVRLCWKQECIAA